MMQESVRKDGAREGTAQKTSVGLWRGRLFYVLSELLWCGLGYLLAGAQMPFGTLPMGPALLCAVPKHSIAVFAGVLLSALIDQTRPWVYIAVCGLLFALGLVVRYTREEHEEKKPLPDALADKLTHIPADALLQDAKGQGGVKTFFLRLFSENACIRMCMGALAALALGMTRVVAGGFAYYDLFASAFSVVTVPLLILLWQWGWAERVHYPAAIAISKGLLLAAAVWSAREFTLLGMPMAVILASAFTAYAASHGSLWGSLGGALMGAAYSPIMAPAFLTSGLILSFCREKGRARPVGEPLSVIAMSVWGLYVGGINAFLHLLPGGLLGVLAYSVFQRLGKRPPVAAEEPAPPDAESLYRLQKEQFTDANQRFRGISDAFSSLSDVFYDLSDRLRRPGVLDLRRICDDAFEHHCADCPNKPLCWGLEYAETLSRVNRLIADLHTHGRVVRADISRELSGRCARLESILDLIDRDCARLTGELLNNRTRIFAMDYGAASAIINDALEEEEGEYRFDRELEKRIGEYLWDAGIGADSVTVWGKRRMQIMVRGVSPEKAKITPGTLREDLGEMCGMELTLPAFRVEGGSHTMVLRAKEKIAVLGARQGICREEGVSGDSINLFSNKKDYFYALLCDGMGSGAEAAYTSGLCSVFLEKMLRAGNRAGTSLKMLNNLICSREAGSLRECSSTVDLLELDLITATATFFKSGACPTFVLREGVARRVSADTAPLGILPETRAAATPYALCPGDTVIMVSDGILGDDPEGRWLTEYLHTASGLAPKQIAAEICRHAAAEGIRDDSSVIALSILAAG